MIAFRGRHNLHLRGQTSHFQSFIRRNDLSGPCANKTCVTWGTQSLIHPGRRAPATKNRPRPPQSSGPKWSTQKRRSRERPHVADPVLSKLEARRPKGPNLRLRRRRLQKKLKPPNPKTRIELIWSGSKEPSPV